MIVPTFALRTETSSWSSLNSSYNSQQPTLGIVPTSCALLAGLLPILLMNNSYNSTSRAVKHAVHTEELPSPGSIANGDHESPIPAQLAVLNRTEAIPSRQIPTLVRCDSSPSA